MAIESVTDLRNTDAGLTAFTVRQNPVGGSTACHAVQVTQSATAGDGAGINVVSNNTSSPAIRARAAGPLMQLYNASNVVKFEVSNTGAVTLYDALTLTSLSTTGNASVGGTLAVTGATTLSTVSTSGAATLASAGVTGNATVGGTLGVTGATTLSSTLGVTGAVTIAGNVTDAGDLLVRDSNTAATKGYRFRTSGGALDTESGGEDWYISTFPNANFTGTQNNYFRLAKDAAVLHCTAEVQVNATTFGASVHTLNGVSNTLGFHGATAVAKQTVAGSRGGNAALANLMTALATLGLFTDGTTA